MQKIVHVAVGVIVDSEQRVLIARRAQNAHQGGLWEFPGGKVEAGETIDQALVRELEEELALKVSRSTPLLEVRHDYSDKSVLLDVWLVTEFSGEAAGLEGQPIEWVPTHQLSEYAFPEANRQIIDKIIEQYAEVGA